MFQEFTSSTFLPDVLPRPSQDNFKIGFLGLGKMGSMIVRGLLNAGLNVMVWNRTPSKVMDVSDDFLLIKLLTKFSVHLLI